MCAARPGEAGTELETRESELVQHNRREAAQCHRQHAAVENRDADERQAEQDEVDGYAQDFRTRDWRRAIDGERR
jgi:hypothetical protein